VVNDSEPHLLAELSYGATMCFSASDPASQRGELWCCHVFLSSGPHLHVEVCSDAAT
jgi:hypothetical protein